MNQEVYLYNKLVYLKLQCTNFCVLFEQCDGTTETFVVELGVVNFLVVQHLQDITNTKALYAMATYQAYRKQMEHNGTGQSYDTREAYCFCLCN